MKLVSAEQMRRIDRETIEDFKIPGIVLMENAGAGCAGLIIDRFPDAVEDGVCVVAGPGNNGGDGFVIARHLWNNGYEVEVHFLGDKERLKGDAKTNFDIIQNIGVPFTEVTGAEEMEILRQDLSDAGLVVDALFGTGLDRDLTGLFREAVDAINESATPVFAVDSPSGLNSDTGRSMPVAVYAEVTGTLGLGKIGQFTHPGHLFCGEVHVVDISLPSIFMEEDEEGGVLLTIPEDFLHLCKPRPKEAHKNKFGHAAVVGGSPGMTGAVALASLAALRVGAGLCTLGIPADLNVAMEAKLTEVMTHPVPQSKGGGFCLESIPAVRAMLKGKNVLALGPGMGQSPEAKRFLAELLPSLDIPVVIDADGLNNLSDQLHLLQKCPADVILTPHPGEMSRLTGKSAKEVMENRVAITNEFAVHHGVYVVLKGARSVVAAPDGRVWINPTGNPGMATAGSGDVLTGVITGLIAQSGKVLDSVVGGTYLHGSAGDRAMERLGEKGMIASDIVEELPLAIKHFQDLFLQKKPGGKLEEESPTPTQRRQDKS